MSSTCKKLYRINCQALLNKCILDDNSNIKFTEDVARSISKLSQLRTLFIIDYTSKKLGKELLLHLTTLSQLRKLRLNGNKIDVDDIDDLFINLSNLQYLDLSHAKSSSEEWSIFLHLTKLRHLKLQSCLCAYGLEVLHDLEELILCDNQIQSEFYSELNSLSKLTRLEYDNNQESTDENLDMIHALTSLKELVVKDESANLTSQAIGFVFASMTNLTRLEWNTATPPMDNNQSSLASITTLYKLESLCLFGQNLDSTDVHHLVNLSKLTSLALYIANNEVAQQILLLTNLKQLYINGPFDYTHEFFAATMPNVSHLEVYGNY